MADDTPRYLDTRQAAGYLGIGASTLNRMRVSGEGPRYSKLGRRVVYDLAWPTWTGGWRSASGASRASRRMRGPDRAKRRYLLARACSSSSSWISPSPIPARSANRRANTCGLPRNFAACFTRALCRSRVSRKAAAFSARLRTFEPLLAERAGIGKREIDELRDVHARAGKYLRSVKARTSHAALRTHRTQNRGSSRPSEPRLLLRPPSPLPNDSLRPGPQKMLPPARTAMPFPTGARSTKSCKGTGTTSSHAPKNLIFRYS